MRFFFNVLIGLGIYFSNFKWNDYRVWEVEKIFRVLYLGIISLDVFKVRNNVNMWMRGFKIIGKSRVNFEVRD